MNSNQFDEMKSRARARQDGILEAKGQDYTTQNEDRLYNFKWIGEMLGIDPKLVCAVYMLKQVLALMNRAKGGKESEPVLGRLDDVTNYMLLMEGLFEDEANERVDDPKCAGCGGEHQVGCGSPEQVRDAECNCGRETDPHGRGITIRHKATCARAVAFRQKGVACDCQQ